MPDKMTYKAATIEANRLRSQERMDIDRPRMNAAIDKLIEAARFRIPRKPGLDINGKHCPVCDSLMINDFCSECGQAIDWSDL